MERIAFLRGFHIHKSSLTRLLIRVKWRKITSLVRKKSFIISVIIKIRNSLPNSQCLKITQKVSFYNNVSEASCFYISIYIFFRTKKWNETFLMIFKHFANCKSLHFLSAMCKLWGSISDNLTLLHLRKKRTFIY